MSHKKQLWLALRSLLVVILGVMITSIGISALSPSTSSGQYMVLATVQPARYIVVDSNLQIKQIVSNTAQDVVPYVVMNTVDGEQMPYTSVIRSQFLSLKHTVDFSKAGIVYNRDMSSGFIGAWHRFQAGVRHFIFG